MLYLLICKSFVEHCRTHVLMIYTFHDAYVTEITEYILQREPTLDRVADSFGKIPLHYAVLNGHHDTVKLLLEGNSSTAYLSDADGFFPIHIAAMMGNIATVDQILKQCPDTGELLDRRGRNLLHVAL